LGRANGGPIGSLNDQLGVDLGGGVTMEFVLIRPGSFTMGLDRGGDEAAHKVTLTKPFYLGKYLVTQEQWERVMGSNPSTFKGARLVVVDVAA
jgi:formylglycine-generating enzyme required for sulfatase activity